MKNRLFQLLPLLVLLLSSTVFAAGSGEFRVVVSIKPVHSLFSALLQGVTEPVLIVGPGRTPYGYRMTEAQEKELQQADLVVWVGPELERFLVEPIRRLPKGVEVLTLLDNDAMKILPSRWDDVSRDPYFWLDSRNVLILIDELTRYLMERDPARTHLYRRNRDRLFKKVAELDRRLEYGYRGLKGGVILNYYDTLQYFEQAYALKVGGTIARDPESPVDAARLLRERARLLEGGYACVLTEAGMSMPEYDLLMKEVSVNRAELDSFGTRFEPGGELYLEVMEHNTRVIKRCVHQAAADLEAEEGEAGLPPVEGVGGRFVLVDHNGNLVTREQMLGRYQLIYFGYTYCPDVCPTSLQVMTAALKKLGALREKIQPYFITVDPERDTQEILAGYVTYFDKRMIGLTGTRAMIDRLLEEFGVTAEKVPDESGDPDKYLIDHTASLYLMAPDGRFITKFAHGITPDQLVQKLRQYVH